MIFTAYQAMRLTGLVLLSDYLESDGSCLTLGKPLGKMRQPFWGVWKSLTDSLARYLSGMNTKYKPDSVPVFENLARAWVDIRRELKNNYPDQVFETEKGQQLPGPAEIFQDLRNKQAHLQGVMDGTGREMEILDSYLPVLEFMLRNLFAQTGLRLLRLPIVGTVEAENIRQNHYGSKVQGKDMADQSLLSDPGIYHIFTNHYQSGPQEEPRLNIPAFSSHEARSAYETRQKNLPEHACLTVYDYLTPFLKQLLTSPLYLHVFHETWKGSQGAPTYRLPWPLVAGIFSIFVQKKTKLSGYPKD